LAWRDWSSIIARQIGVHPRALLEYEQPAGRHQGQDRRTDGRLCRSGQFYVDRLAEGIATLTAAFAPMP
jgi:pyruvate,water dikinase